MVLFHDLQFVMNGAQTASNPPHTILVEFFDALIKDLKAVASKKVPDISSALERAKSTKESFVAEINKQGVRHDAETLKLIINDQPERFLRPFIQPFFVDWKSIAGGKHIPSLLKANIFLLKQGVLSGHSAIKDFEDAKGYKPGNLLSQIGMEVIRYPHGHQTSPALKLEFISHVFSSKMGDEIDNPLYVRIVQHLLREYITSLTSKKARIPMYHCTPENSNNGAFSIPLLLASIVQAGTTKSDDSSRICAVQLICVLVSYARSITSALGLDTAAAELVQATTITPYEDFHELVENDNTLDLTSKVSSATSQKMNTQALTQALIIILQLLLEILCSIPDHHILLLPDRSEAVERINGAHGRVALTEFLYGARVLGLVELVLKLSSAPGRRPNQSLIRAACMLFEKVFQIWGNLPIGGSGRTLFRPLSSVYINILTRLLDILKGKPNRILAMETSSCFCRLLGGIDHTSQMRMPRERPSPDKPEIDVIAAAKYSRVMFHFNMVDVPSVHTFVPGSSLAKFIINFDGDALGTNVFALIVKAYLDPELYRTGEVFDSMDSGKRQQSMSAFQDDEISAGVGELAKCDKEFVSLFDGGRLSTFLGGVIHIGSPFAETTRARSSNPSFYSRDGDSGLLCAQMKSSSVSDICNSAARRAMTYQNFLFETSGMIVQEREGMFFVGPVSSIFTEDGTQTVKMRTIPFSTPRFIFFNIQTLRLYTVAVMLNALAILCERTKEVIELSSKKDLEIDVQNSLSAESIGTIERKRTLLASVIKGLGEEKYKDVLDKLEASGIDMGDTMGRDSASVAKLFLDLSNYRPSMISVGLKIKDVGDILTNDKIRVIGLAAETRSGDGKTNCGDSSSNTTDGNKGIAGVTTDNNIGQNNENERQKEAKTNTNDCESDKLDGEGKGDVVTEVAADAKPSLPPTNDNVVPPGSVSNADVLNDFLIQLTICNETHAALDNAASSDGTEYDDDIFECPDIEAELAGQLDQQCDADMEAISEADMDAQCLSRQPSDDSEGKEAENTAAAVSVVMGEEFDDEQPVSNSAEISVPDEVPNQIPPIQPVQSCASSSSPKGVTQFSVADTAIPTTSYDNSQHSQSCPQTQRVSQRQPVAGTTSAKMILALIYTLFTRLDVPGESQKIDRLMEQATRVDATYRLLDTKGRVDTFDSRNKTSGTGGEATKNNTRIETIIRNYMDIVYPLLFSLVMLNTDLHSVSIKPEDKMRLSQFVSNTQALKENLIGEDISGVSNILSDDNLKIMYNYIKNKEMVNAEIKDLKEGNGPSLVWKKLGSNEWKLINSCRLDGSCVVDGVLERILEIDRDCGLLGTGAPRLLTYVDGRWRQGLSDGDLNDDRPLLAGSVNLPHVLTLMFGQGYIAAAPEKIFILPSFLTELLTVRVCELNLLAHLLFMSSPETRIQKIKAKIDFSAISKASMANTALILESYNVITMPVHFDTSIIQTNIVISLLKLSEFSPRVELESLVPKLFDALRNKASLKRRSDQPLHPICIHGMDPISTSTLLLFVLVNHIFYKTLELKQYKLSSPELDANTLHNNSLIYTEDLTKLVERNKDMFLYVSQYIGESLNYILNRGYVDGGKLKYPHNVLFSVLEERRDRGFKLMDKIKSVPSSLIEDYYVFNALNIYSAVLRFYTPPTTSTSSSMVSSTSNLSLSYSVSSETLTNFQPSFFNIDLDLLRRDLTFTDTIRQIARNELFVPQDKQPKEFMESSFGIDAIPALLDPPSSTFYNQQQLLTTILESMFFASNHKSARALKVLSHLLEHALVSLKSIDTSHITMHSSCFRSCRFWSVDAATRHSLVHPDGSPITDKLIKFLSEQESITTMFAENDVAEKLKVSCTTKKVVDNGSNISITASGGFNLILERLSDEALVKYTRGVESQTQQTSNSHPPFDLGLFSLVFFASFVNHIKPLQDLVHLIFSLSSFVVEFRYTPTDSFMKDKPRAALAQYDKVYNAAMVPMLYAMTNAVVRIDRLSESKKAANASKIQAMLEEASDFIMQAFPNSLEPICPEKFFSSSVITDLALTTLVGELAAIGQTIPNKPFSTCISKLPSLVYDLIKKARAEEKLEEHQSFEFPPLLLVPTAMRDELGWSCSGVTTPTPAPAPSFASTSMSTSTLTSTGTSVCLSTSVPNSPSASSSAVGGNNGSNMPVTLSDRAIEAIFSEGCWSKTIGLTLRTATSIHIREAFPQAQRCLESVVESAKTHSDLFPLASGSYFTVTTDYDAVVVSTMDVIYKTATKQATLQNGSFEMLYDVVLKAIEAVEIGDLSPTSRESKSFYFDVNSLTNFVSAISKTFVFTETRKNSLLNKCVGGTEYKCLEIPFGNLRADFFPPHPFGAEMDGVDDGGEGKRRREEIDKLGVKYATLLTKRVLRPVFDYSFDYCNILQRGICPDNPDGLAFISSKMESIMVDIQYIIRTTILILISSRFSRRFHEIIVSEFLDVMAQHDVFTFFAVELVMVPLVSVLEKNPILTEELLQHIIKTLEQTTSRLIEYVNNGASLENVRSHVIFAPEGRLLEVYTRYIIEVARHSNDIKFRLQLLAILKKIILEADCLKHTIIESPESGFKDNVALGVVVFRCYYKLCNIIIKDATSTKQMDIKLPDLVKILIEEHYSAIIIRHTNTTIQQWTTSARERQESTSASRISRTVVKYNIPITLALHSLAKGTEEHALAGLVFETAATACFNFLQRARRTKCEYTRKCTECYAEATRKLLLEQPLVCGSEVKPRTTKVVGNEGNSEGGAEEGKGTENDQK